MNCAATHRDHDGAASRQGAGLDTGLPQALGLDQTDSAMTDRDKRDAGQRQIGQSGRGRDQTGRHRGGQDVDRTMSEDDRPATSVDEGVGLPKRR
jgi:hypothetical protein